MIITGTYNLKADLSWSLQQLEALYLECDTTLLPVTINLFEIKELQGYKNLKIYISDIGNNASTNSIVINATGFDKINQTGQTTFTITTNGGCCVISIVNESKWFGNSQSSITSAYDTIENQSVALPQRNILDFQGLGVLVADNGSKTIVTIPQTLPSSNYGLYTQIVQGPQVANTNIESSLVGAGLGTLSVPPNTFVAGDSFHAIMTGAFNSANNQGLDIKIKANGLILADTGVITTNTATNRHFKLEVYFTVRTIGISGVASIVTGGTFMYTKNASVTFEGSDFSTETFVGFDTTVLNVLEITAKWTAANPNNNIYSELFTLTKTY